MKAVIALALLSCIAIGLADFNQESDETRVLRRSKRAAEPTFSNSKAKSFKKKAGRGPKKAGKGPKKAGKSGKAMKKKSGKAGKRRRTGKKGQKKKAKKTKSGKGKKTKSALSGVRAGGRVLKGNGCEYVSLNEVIANGIGCANGFKFVLKGATNTRRQFLIINDKVILAFVAAGTKFPECTSFTDVTANVDCKAVTDLINVDLAATATTTAAGATTTASTVADTTAAAADTTSTTSAATTTTGSGSFKCGIKTRKRIVGGSAAQVNEYPWMVALGSSGGGWVGCGATLVAAEWVICAAHCFGSSTTASDYSVILGEHDFSSTTETDRLVVEVSKVILHENYNPSRFINDITLLKLASKVNLNTYTPACLPSAGSTYVGKTAWIYGWGTTTYGAGVASDILLEVQVPIVSTSTCKTAYPNAITDGMVCAGETGKDACQGDSGGPMTVVNSDNQHELVGVTSWGEGCAAEGKYGVYANVPNYRTWLDDKFSANGGATFTP